MKTTNNFSNLNSSNINNYVDELSNINYQRCEINRFINSRKLSKILDYICVDKWCIGGTVALRGGYKIPIPRKEVSDIDVIVPVGTINRIASLIRDDPFFKVISHNTLVQRKEYEDNLYNEHIEFRCAEGPVIDIVERGKEDDSWDPIYTDNGNPLCPLEVIINTKKKWGREKDIKDLEFISKYMELMGYINEEPEETATLENINKMFDNLKEIEIEENLKKHAPHKIGDIIKFIGMDMDTYQSKTVTGPMTAHNKIDKIIWVYDYDKQKEIAYRVDQWLIDLLA